MSHSSAPNPTPNWLPASFPLFMAVTLLHALPRPNPKQPAVNRSRIQCAFALIREYAPRDTIEAHLVLQIAIMLEQGPRMQVLAAAHQSDLKAALRFERQGMAATRCMLRLMDRLRDHRREERAASVEAPWEYDPAEMEAIWREGVEVETPAAPEETGRTIAARDAGDDAPVAPAGEDFPVVAGEAVMPPMSRQQRRALERMQQKLARRVAVKMAVQARELARVE
jgi:hypothetical protein